MVVNIALAVAVGSRLFPRVSSLDWTILAASGTIGALFGTPVAAALIFSQTLNSSNDTPLWDRLFAPPPRRRRRRVDDGSVFPSPFFAADPALWSDALR